MVWLKRIVITLVVLAVLFVGVSFLLPGEYRVERSVVIDSSPEQIHVLVGDLRRWTEWTVWTQRDPSIETVYGETTTGVGAHQSWSGDSGSGELTFTRWDTQSGVAYDMSFDEGKYLSTGGIAYETTGEGTRVVWTMEGSADPVIGRYFGLMMDSMVGSDFEEGLAALKAKAEAMPRPEPTAEKPETEESTG